MGGVRLDDHRTAGGEGRGSVATSDRKGEGKIRRSEHRDRTESDVAEPQIGLRNRLAVGFRWIETQFLESTVSDLLREEPKLSDRPGTLSFDAVARQSRLVDHSQDEFVAKGREFLPRSLPGSGLDL